MHDNWENYFKCYSLHAKNLLSLPFWRKSNISLKEKLLLYKSLWQQVKSRKPLLQGVKKLDLVRNRWISAAVLFHQVFASGEQLMLNFVQNFLFLHELKILKCREMTFVLGLCYIFTFEAIRELQGCSIGLTKLKPGFSCTVSPPHCCLSRVHEMHHLINTSFHSFPRRTMEAFVLTNIPMLWVRDTGGWNATLSTFPTRSSKKNQAISLLNPSFYCLHSPLW